MDTDLEEIVSGLLPHFNALEIQFMIVGAKARDIISHQNGLRLSSRKTSDVDFGILVNSWETLDSLRGAFKQDPKIKVSSDKNNHVRYYYQGRPFDLVPFGGVEKDGKVTWPPLYESIMTVVGYKEALEFATDIKVGSHKVKVVTPEMLVALKFVSWEENSTRQRDAADINYIISNYEKIDPNTDDFIWENYEKLPEKFDHDMSLAAIVLMGIRIKSCVSEVHVDLILNVLKDADTREKFARKMWAEKRFIDDDVIDETALKLKALFVGLQA